MVGGNCSHSPIFWIENKWFKIISWPKFHSDETKKGTHFRSHIFYPWVLTIKCESSQSKIIWDIWWHLPVAWLFSRYRMSVFSCTFTSLSIIWCHHIHIGYVFREWARFSWYAPFFIRFIYLEHGWFLILRLMCPTWDLCAWQIILSSPSFALGFIKIIIFISFYKNQLMLAEARMFLVLILIFSIFTRPLPQIHV